MPRQTIRERLFLDLGPRCVVLVGSAAPGAD
jgi:predicted nucleotidyltransferase